MDRHKRDVVYRCVSRLTPLSANTALSYLSRTFNLFCGSKVQTYFFDSSSPLPSLAIVPVPSNSEPKLLFFASATLFSPQLFKFLYPRKIFTMAMSASIAELRSTTLAVLFKVVETNPYIELDPLFATLRPMLGKLKEVCKIFEKVEKGEDAGESSVVGKGIVTSALNLFYEEHKGLNTRSEAKETEMEPSRKWDVQETENTFLKKQNQTLKEKIRYLEGAEASQSLEIDKMFERCCELKVLIASKDAIIRKKDDLIAAQTDELATQEQAFKDNQFRLEDRLKERAKQLEEANQKVRYLRASCFRWEARAEFLRDELQDRSEILSDTICDLNAAKNDLRRTRRELFVARGERDRVHRLRAMDQASCSSCRDQRTAESDDEDEEWESARADDLRGAVHSILRESFARAETAWGH